MISVNKESLNDFLDIAASKVLKSDKWTLQMDGHGCIIATYKNVMSITFLGGKIQFDTCNDHNIWVYYNTITSPTSCKDGYDKFILTNKFSRLQLMGGVLKEDIL